MYQDHRSYVQHQYNPNQYNPNQYTDNCLYTSSNTNITNRNLCHQPCLDSCNVQNYPVQTIHQYPTKTSSNNAFTDCDHNTVNKAPPIYQRSIYQPLHQTARTNIQYCCNQSNTPYISSHPIQHSHNPYPNHTVPQSIQYHQPQTCNAYNCNTTANGIYNDGQQATTNVYNDYQQHTTNIYNDNNEYRQRCNTTTKTIYNNNYDDPYIASSNGIQSNECYSAQPTFSWPQHRTYTGPPTTMRESLSNTNDSISSNSLDSSPRFPLHTQDVMNEPQSVVINHSKPNDDVNDVDEMQIIANLTSNTEEYIYNEKKSNRGRKKIDRSEFLNLHGRYQCKLCPKSYKRYNDLKGHYAIHDDNTECCPHCQKKFSRPIYLRDHIRTHTGEKPFSCDICLKQFAAKRNLVQHRKRHFRENSRLIGY